MLGVAPLKAASIQLLMNGFLRDNFDEQAVRKIAETARARFEGMPGLRSKAFTLNSGKREATNFYVWDSEEAAKAFFTDELLERVASLTVCAPASSSCK